MLPRLSPLWCLLYSFHFIAPILSSCFVKLTGAVTSASKEELMVMAVAEIVAELIKAHEEKKDVNLNK